MRINSINIQNFKCFNNNTIRLDKLTLLAGENASGKSSLLHIFALLHQTISEAQYSKELPLNGLTLNLGMCEDIINKQFGGDTVKINLSTDVGQYNCDLKTPDKLATGLSFIKGLWKDKDGNTNALDSAFYVSDVANPKCWLDFIKGLRSLTYLSADRSGPKEVHSIEGTSQYQNVGSRGERTIWYLNKHQDYEVINLLRKPDVSPWLIRQVEAWMQDFFPGFQLELLPVRRTNLATLGMLTDSSTGYLRPQNIGFGLSYTLPIFVTCLGAKRGEIVLIENPEAHLHPSGQSRMGEFLAHVSKAGIQVVVETHSDHVLNGVRKAMKCSKLLRGSEVAIHFFNPCSKSSVPQVSSPVIGDDGSINEWPTGFFDQFDKDLEVLTDWEM